MKPGFHSGSLWLHDPGTAVRLLCEIGYRAVALRSRRGVLVPGESTFARQWEEVLAVASDHRCQLVIDSEAPYVLDPRESAMPGLAEPDSRRVQRTVQWLEDWLSVLGPAASWGQTPIVTLGSGPASPPDGDRLRRFETDPHHPAERAEQALERLADQLQPLCRRAADSGALLALRPARGHVIDSVADFERLAQWLSPGSADAPLALAADVGEMLVAGEIPLAARLQRHPDTLALVYLCDPRWDVSGGGGALFQHSGPATDAGMFPAGWMGGGDQWIGQGEVAVGRLVDALARHGYGGPVIARVEGRAAWGVRPAEEAWRRCFTAGS